METIVIKFTITVSIAVPTKDPARDPNMKELWRVNKTLPVFPRVIIAGPQKTGIASSFHFFIDFFPSETILILSNKYKLPILKL